MAERESKSNKIHPALNVYHGNAKNTGSAMAIRVSPAELNQSGYVQIEMARQKTAVGMGDSGYPTFDWKNRAILRLNPFEVCEVIRCIRGISESINDGNGIIHKSDRSHTKFTFAHADNMNPCFAAKVWQKMLLEDEVREVSVILTANEADTIEMALSAELGRICFG